MPKPKARRSSGAIVSHDATSGPLLNPDPEETKKGRGRPERPPTVSVSARLPVELVNRVERFIGATRPEPTMKSVLEDALEQYLLSKGFPPADQEE